MSHITAQRYHDFSAGHRVTNHESMCSNLHGHNYRVTFTVRAPLDGVGRVMDFSAIKDRLCMWLEGNWDHRFIAWQDDPVMCALSQAVGLIPPEEEREITRLRFTDSIVWVPFNPTAENMAKHLLEIVGPEQLRGTGVQLIAVVVEETRKCSASASIFP